MNAIALIEGTTNQYLEKPRHFSNPANPEQQAAQRFIFKQPSADDFQYPAPMALRQWAQMANHPIKNTKE